MSAAAQTNRALRAIEHSFKTAAAAKTFPGRLPVCTPAARHLVLTTLRQRPQWSTHELFQHLLPPVPTLKAKTKAKLEAKIRTSNVRKGKPDAPVVIHIKAPKPVVGEKVIRHRGPAGLPLPVNSVVPSMTYLKHVVLPDLISRRKIEKIHMHKVSVNPIKATSQQLSSVAARKTRWVWRLVPKEHRVRRARVGKRVFGTEVGVGMDWGHLNKRRLRARREKVSRAVAFLRDVQDLRTRVKAARKAAQEKRVAEGSAAAATA